MTRQYPSLRSEDATVAFALWRFDRDESLDTVTDGIEDVWMFLLRFPSCNLDRLTEQGLF